MDREGAEGEIDREGVEGAEGKKMIDIEKGDEKERGFREKHIREG